MKTVIFYHQNCLDGGLALGILYEQLTQQGQDVDVVGLQYPADIDASRYKNCNIVVLDYVIPAATQKSLLANNKLFILDHHIAYKETFREVFDNIENNQKDKYFVIYSDKISAAGLTSIFGGIVGSIIAGTYRYGSSIYETKNTILLNIYPTTSIEKIDDFLNVLSYGEPELIHMLSNSDAYSNPERIDYDRQVRVGMEYFESIEPERSFMTFNYLHRRYKNNVEALQAKGEEIETAALPELQALASQATVISGIIDGGRGPIEVKFYVLHAPHDKVNTLMSYLISKDQSFHFAAFGRVTPENPTDLAVSLRGNNRINLDIDLSALANAFNGGGGGHFNAAGARFYDYTDGVYRSVELWEQTFHLAYMDASDLKIISTPDPEPEQPI